jgi:DNA-binding IclR family transcriptional regulator
MEPNYTSEAVAKAEAGLRKLVEDYHSANPDLSYPRIAMALGLSPSTVYRILGDES